MRAVSSSDRIFCSRTPNLARCFLYIRPTPQFCLITCRRSRTSRSRTFLRCLTTQGGCRAWGLCGTGLLACALLVPHLPLLHFFGRCSPGNPSYYRRKQRNSLGRKRELHFFLLYSAQASSNGKSCGGKRARERKISSSK